jgi:hypothetical protein
MSLIVQSRYLAARDAGVEREAALGQAYAGGGQALAVPAAAAIAGLLALAATDVRILRGFGLAGSIGLALTLAGAALVLPAAIAWAEDRGPLKVPRPRAPARLRQERP